MCVDQDIDRIWEWDNMVGSKIVFRTNWPLLLGTNWPLGNGRQSCDSV